MKFLLIVFLCSSLSAQWPKPNEVKIILSANSSKSDKKIANEMAKFFSKGDAFIQEDMIVEDNYAEKFFTYYTHSFLIILGKNNRLSRLGQSGVKINGDAPFYTEQGMFNRDIAYIGIRANPLFLKARFIGAAKGVVPASLFVGGTNDKMTLHAWDQLKKGWIQGTWTADTNAVKRGTKSLWGQMQLRDRNIKKDKKHTYRKYEYGGFVFTWKPFVVDDLGRLSELD